MSSVRCGNAGLWARRPRLAACAEAVNRPSPRACSCPDFSAIRKQTCAISTLRCTINHRQDPAAAQPRHNWSLDSSHEHRGLRSTDLQSGRPKGAGACRSEAGVVSRAVVRPRKHRRGDVRTSTSGICASRLGRRRMDALASLLDLTGSLPQDVWMAPRRGLPRRRAAPASPANTTARRAQAAAGALFPTGFI